MPDQKKGVTNQALKPCLSREVTVAVNKGSFFLKLHRVPVKPEELRDRAKQRCILRRDNV